MRRAGFCVLVVTVVLVSLGAAGRGKESGEAWEKISLYFAPPAQYAGKFGNYRSPLLFDDGTRVQSREDWQRRRAEILADWNGVMGAWPAVIERPRIESLGDVRRESFTQRSVRVETAPGQMTKGYLLIPDGDGPFPAVFVPFYEAETSTGQNANKLRDFAYQLTKRGFVTLSIGSPGGDARKPDAAGIKIQPLSFLGYVAANGYQALASLPQVDGKRVGIVGHSYGGKWAMFGACLWALLEFSNTGAINGAHPAGMLDTVYLSATTFSTLGFGDLTPVGPVRFLTGTESVSGFILISWSASFLYLEMQEFWRRRI